MIAAGAVLTLDVEKAAAGGRMLARHGGQVVLVAHAIPGERVAARVERLGKGVVFAETIEVVDASPDRRAGGDWKCGGNLLAHIAYPRQLALKGEIVRDAFARIGRVPLPAVPPVIASPEHGYRMRARFHVHGGRLGFYREGTHALCDPGGTRQLLDSTLTWIRDVESALAEHQDTAVRAVELSEDRSGEQRAAFFETASGARPEWLEPLAGPDAVVDRLAVDGSGDVELRRSARSFFQGNRYLLERMVAEVAALVPPGPVVDLYAGVGLFGLTLAARGDAVTLVEGDQSSGADLVVNARPFGERARVVRSSVEGFLSGGAAAADAVVVDPPRTGLSRETLAALIRRQPANLVYVSCDPATLARDTRALLDAGYELGPLTGIDLFPNTAHVETIVVLRRS